MSRIEEALEKAAQLRNKIIPPIPPEDTEHDDLALHRFTLEETLEKAARLREEKPD